METISVFYSTTEEESLAKYQAYFRELCERVGRILDVHFDVKYWRDLAGGLGPSPQTVIDERIAGRYDVYFGIMGTKFGSGTEHEYRRAVEDHINNGRPIAVCFGFCETAINPFSIDPTSLATLKQFRTDVGDGSKYKLANLYFTFSDKTTFCNRAEANLKRAVEDIKGRIKGGARFK